MLESNDIFSLIFVIFEFIQCIGIIFAILQYRDSNQRELLDLKHGVFGDEDWTKCLWLMSVGILQDLNVDASIKLDLARFGTEYGKFYIRTVKSGNEKKLKELLAYEHAHRRILTHYYTNARKLSENSLGANNRIEILISTCTVMRLASTICGFGPTTLVRILNRPVSLDDTLIKYTGDHLSDIVKLYQVIFEKSYWKRKPKSYNEQLLYNTQRWDTIIDLIKSGLQDYKLQDTPSLIFKENKLLERIRLLGLTPLERTNAYKEIHLVPELVDLWSSFSSEDLLSVLKSTKNSSSSSKQETGKARLTSSSGMITISKMNI